MKAAAADVQHVRTPNPPRDFIETYPALFLDFQQAGFAQDTKVFGDVVLRNPEPFGNIANAHGFLEEHGHDSSPGIFAERPQHTNTIHCGLRP